MKVDSLPTEPPGKPNVYVYRVEYVYTCVYICVCVCVHTSVCRCVCLCVSVCMWASQIAQWVKNSPAMQETWLPSLGWKDSLEKEMAAHASILAWRIPWTEEGYSS